MRTRAKAQKVHFGVRNGLRRRDNTIKFEDGERRVFPSIRAAKYFMRTGEERAN